MRRGMSGRAVVVGIAVCGIAAPALSSCGGGGSGYGGSPMPTVMFTSPTQASTINFGQAVKLAWTSTYATSCSATASSMVGGAFTGMQALSGEATVAPTGAGSVTYTLTCTGASGTAEATSPAVTVNPSILSVLATAKITTIGSTIDPIEKGGNPYGLTIAPVTAGLITAGDLVICNFNDGATNTQGLGTTIVGLHPTAGATPYRIAQSPDLQGCTALTMLPDDSISAAAYAANKNSLVTASGVVDSPFAADTFHEPWGEEFVAAHGQSAAALYISNADGSIDRISLSSDTQSTFTEIATGFCQSGMPGAIFAPSGLTYDASIDALYIVDTSSNSVVAFANVSSIGADGVVVNGQCSAVATPLPLPLRSPARRRPLRESSRIVARSLHPSAPPCFLTAT